MAVNRTKVLEAAQKFLSKGQYDKAIAEYQKLVVEDPRDVRTLLKIGDLHTKRNKPKDAIDVYQKVAELYAKQGFFLKAVAVYKQILKLDPTHIDSSQKLAKMYEELALTSDALNTYEQVADAYLAQGQTDKALETMERMVELDGQNVAVRIKYAEALSKAEKTKEAAKAFAEGAALLKEQGRMDDYIRVVERQLYHDADNLDLARTLSSLYLERNDPKRALAKLQICFKADPRDVQTLEMLAEAFRQLGQIPKTISVLKEISRLHAEFGATEARKRTLKRVLDLDPNDAEAKQGLGAAGGAPTQQQRTSPSVAQPQRPSLAQAPGANMPSMPQPVPGMPSAAQPLRPAAAAPTSPQRTMQGMAPSPAQAAASQPQLAKSTRAPSSFPPIPEPEDEVELSVDEGSEYDLLDSTEDASAELLSDDLDADADEVLIVDDRTDRHLEPELAASKPAAATARHQETKQERIARLLSDADAHEGYGLYDKVEALLKEVLTIDGEHLPTHERLKDLYIATDRRVDATRELLWLSDMWTERNLDRAIHYARDAYELAPHAAATKSRLLALGVNPERESSEDVMFVEDSKVGPLAAAAPAPVAAPKAAPLRKETRPDDDAPARPTVAQDRPLLLVEEDPLDIPISPDEFDAAPPVQTRALSRSSYADLLDEEISPEDFDREEAPEPRGLSAGGAGELPDDDMEDLLDAPISPDEFDAPPPRRSMVGPSDVEDLLSRPQPDDDFGLSDERYDRSGLIDADSTEIGDAIEIRAAVAKSVEQDALTPAHGNLAQSAEDDEPSVEFVEVGTGEIDVAEMEAAEAAEAAAAATPIPGPAPTKPKAPEPKGPEVFAELGTGELEFDSSSAKPKPIAAPAKPAAPPIPAPVPAPLPSMARKSLAFDALPSLPPLAAPKPAAARPGAPPPPAVPPFQPAPSFALSPKQIEEAAPEPATIQDASPVFSSPPDADAELLFVEPDSEALTEPEDVEVTSQDATAEAESDLTPEIEETIDEADFFASQGMMDEAVELIQEAILIYPGNKALKAKMLEYEAAADEQEAQEEAEAEAKKNQDDSFDIAEQLADSGPSNGPSAAVDEMVDVESVFAQFKKGVSEQIDIDDSETHFDLGIAYKEMGLVSDAMQEFEIAARGEKRACAAIMMIGTCALEQGDLQKAVDQFNRGLATKHKTAGEELALSYELGNAYEMLGQVDRAIKAFEQAAQRDRTFRGVVQRIDTLKKRRGPMASDDADVDAALDELLGG